MEKDIPNKRLFWKRLGWVIVGAVIVIVLEVGGFFYVFFTEFSCRDLTEEGWVNIGPVSIAPDWSVTLQEQPAHEFLAEYYYRIHIFHQDGRKGNFGGTVDLPINTGGRTLLNLFIHCNPSGQATHLEVVERISTTFIDLARAKAVEKPPPDSIREHVGQFNGEAYPTKFVPYPKKVRKS